MNSCKNCGRNYDDPICLICRRYGADNDPTEWIPRIVTHADHLRSLPDEELADELLDWFAAFYAVEWSKERVLEHLKERYEPSNRKDDSLCEQNRVGTWDG